jgi:hypothetical protein
MAEHLEQKFLSELAVICFCVSRFITALYTLLPSFTSTGTECRLESWHIQVRMPAEVDATSVAADFTADRAHAELKMP